MNKLYRQSTAVSRHLSVQSFIADECLIGVVFFVGAGRSGLFWPDIFPREREREKIINSDVEIFPSFHLPALAWIFQSARWRWLEGWGKGGGNKELITNNLRLENDTR